LAVAPSQANTSSLFFVAGFCQTGRFATGSQPRPRYDGMQRHRAAPSSNAEQLLEWAM
jgi:hypothetical protein